MSSPLIFLVDNGSLRPQATLWLRYLAETLTQRLGLRVEAVSLLHSHKVPVEDLNQQPAQIVKQRLRACCQSGQRKFICLPLFLGPSRAISDYLPKVVRQVKEAYPELEVRLASVLAGVNPDAPDPRLAEILADQIRTLQPTDSHKIALVDHGTPVQAVNRVRNAVARQLAGILQLPTQAILPCSMERRAGEAYAFNEPLLETLGEVESIAGGHLILALFFLLPGRHAGAGGDIAQICEGLMERQAFGRIQATGLLGEHPLLLDILEDRLRSVL